MLTISHRARVTENEILVHDNQIVQLISRDFSEPADTDEIAPWTEEIVSIENADLYNDWVIDFSQAEFLSSACLNTLIILDKRLKAKQKRLRLCCLRLSIQELFSLTRLDKLFEIHPTFEVALASLK